MKKVGVVLLAILFSFPTHLLQAFSAEIALRSLGGTVLDDMGKPVEGAEMVLQDPHSGKNVAQVVTNAKGEYALGCFPLGQYRLTVNPQATDSKGPQTFAADLGRNGLTVNVTSSKTALPVAFAKNPGPAPCKAGEGHLANPGIVAAGSFAAVGATALGVWILCETEVFSGCDDDGGGRRGSASPFQ
ncbi:MAG: carboxypeptidase-like regulatory domain-containing protein [Candidatus Binatia bacterium]